MIVTHKDRNGKAWRFDLRDATPYQMGLFRRVVYAVRNVVKAEGLTLAYLANLDGNDAFLDEIEAAVLSALSQRFPAPQEQARPARVSGTVNVNPSTVSGTVNTNRADDEPTRYYWENF